MLRFEIVAALQMQPELRRRPEIATEAQRRIRGDGARAVHDLIDTPRRDADVARQAILRQPKGLQEVRKQDFAWVDRRELRGYGNSAKRY